MFFPERIISIKESDRVLEIGPGVEPFHRSDVLLEKSFSNEDSLKQNGFSGILKTNKKVVYYDGHKFPFEDNEFDYVICSHVLEHIESTEFEHFIKEIVRVAKKGYFEFPTVYYDYLYNFDVHVTFVLFSNGFIKYFPKKDSGLDQFSQIQKFFYATAVKGHCSQIESLKKSYFQGFEWGGDVKVKRARSLSEVMYSEKQFEDIENFTSIKAPKSFRQNIRLFLNYLLKKI